MIDKKTRLVIIIGSILTFVVVPVATVLVLSQTQNQPTSTEQTTKPPADRSKDDISEAITDAAPSLKDQDGVPLFTVTDIKKPQERWYVVTITSNAGDGGTTVPNYAILYDYDNTTGEDTLAVFAGPDTEFTPDEIELLGLPDTVKEELDK